MDKDTRHGFHSEKSPNLSLDILNELKRIEIEYDELERIASEMLHGGSSYSTSRFFTKFFRARFRQVSDRYEKVSRAISRLYS